MKHLDQGEVLLVEQEIQSVEETEQVAATELDDFYRQEANITFPGLPWAPYVSIYYLGENFYNKEKIEKKREKTLSKLDSKISKAAENDKERRADRLREKRRDKVEKYNKLLEEGNILMRIGEPITVWDSTLTAESAEQMTDYLHTQGYFLGEVTYQAEVKDRKAHILYQVKEGPAYTIDSLKLTITNQDIRELIVKDSANSLLEQGMIYQQDALTSERQRIDNILKDNGYYAFSPQYIEFNVDSTLGDHRVAVETVIYPPEGRGYHKQFTLDSVIFVTDATTRNDRIARDTRTFNNITYRFQEEQYSKKVLDNRVFIRPGNLYSRQKSLETQKQLANLDIFKFININYDTTGDKFISRIYTSPLKKYQTSNEVGLTVSQGTPGPFFNSNWLARNIFGGLEILELNLRASIEGIPSATETNTALTSRQFTSNLSLIFPQFLVPLSSSLRNTLGRYNPKTRLLLGYNYSQRPEFTRSSINSSLSYSWQTEFNRRDNFYNNLYTVVPFDVSIIQNQFSNSQEGDRFQQQLEDWFQQGNPYIFSFQPSFVSSIYGFVVLNKNNYGTYLEKSRYIRPFIESGGTLQNLFSYGFTEPGNTEDNGLQTYRYIKLSNDYRKFIPLGEDQAFAYRLNIGGAFAYGSGVRTLPYEKFFFAGGSNSVRAFRPRRLGPGSALADSTQNYTNQVEVPGEILLEGSLEYRHNIFGFLNGAVFLDFGNVWRVEKTDAFPGGEFSFDRFYREIALGTGYGFRLDFSFLIVRLDLGLKLYNPMRPEGDRWMFDKYNVGSLLQDDVMVLNLSIGYPF